MEDGEGLLGPQVVGDDDNCLRPASVARCRDQLRSEAAAGDEHVNLYLLQDSERFLGAAALPCHFHVTFETEEVTEAFAKERLVLHHQNSNHGRFCARKCRRGKMRYRKIVGRRRKIAASNER